MESNTNAPEWEISTSGEQVVKCPICDKFLNGAVVPEETEDHLAGIHGFSPFLAKACVDPFQYALALTTGAIFTFEYAEAIDNEWVRLMHVKHWRGNKPISTGRYCGYDDKDASFSFDRGLEVRIRDIIWVADAPWGS